MPVPGYQEFMRPLLEVVNDGQDRNVQIALASDLLERVKAASPQFFEHLVVQLLVAMGYGGSMEDAGKAVGGAAAVASVPQRRRSPRDS